jgi:hypothetical protein
MFGVVTVLCTVAKCNNILEEQSLSTMSEGESSMTLQNVCQCIYPHQTTWQIQFHYSSWRLSVCTVNLTYQLLHCEKKN